MIKKNTYNFTYVVHTHTHTTFSGFARVCEPNDVHICPVCLHSLIFTQDKLTMFTSKQCQVGPFSLST